MEVKSKQI